MSAVRSRKGTVAANLTAVVVFLLFATLAAAPQWFGWVFDALDLSGSDFGWGKLFQSDRFNLADAKAAQGY